MRHRVHRGHHPRGITLVELMVVVSIIGILSALLITRMAEARRDAIDGRAIDILGQLRNAVTQYEAMTGVFPAAMTNGMGGEWDGWVAQIEGQLGNLQLPRAPQMQQILNGGAPNNGALFGPGAFGDPYGMGIQPAGGRGIWFRATPYQMYRCPQPPWSTTGCAILR